MHQFLCERQCAAEPAHAPVQAACAALATCDALPTCLAAGPIPEGCGMACMAIGACDGLIGGGDGAQYADNAACAIDCAGRAALAGDTYPGNLTECVGEAMCDAQAVAECVENPQDLCEEGLTAIQACGLEALVALGGVDQFLVDCRNNLAMSPDVTTMQLECILDAEARAMCFDIITCLLPF
ncbi:MAG: hypothetical protein KC613_27015 [Myxococcales bacterium]|nr:hypothetical protein [Myxococcales bacterium]